MRETRQELYNIFNHYKKKYSLKTFCDISSQGQYCNYNDKGDYIQISIKFLKKSILYGSIKERSGLEYIHDNIVWSLLHEIKHAIDKDRIFEEIQHINIGEYKEGGDYHDTRDFEIRADNFAREEIKQWIK